MRFLIDNPLSPIVAEALGKAGHHAVHVRDLGLAGAEDETVFDLAADEQRVVVSADTDFGTILATREAKYPSVILFRRGTQRRPRRQVALLLANFDRMQEALESGSLVVIEEGRIRIRRLPFGRT